MSATSLKFCGLLLVLGFASGCGKTDPAATASSSSDAAPTQANEPTPLPTASIGANPLTALTEPATESAAEVEPAEGTPEWLVREIQRIRLLPFPAMEGDDEESNGNAPAATEITPEKAKAAEERMAQIRTIRKDRNQQVIKLATGALVQTSKDPAKEAVFNAAVHHFLDAHLQLALQGDEQSIGALYEAAEAFFAKKPNTTAAAEAQLTLVNLAQANALRYAKTEPRWLQEFARHAQLLATRFPTEGDAALPLLLAAGRSCEVNGLMNEAVTCFSLIESKFPETPQGLQAAGVLRRLKLPGQKLQLAGPTLDGGYASIEDHAGKSVIVVFWSSHTAPFVQQVETLKTVAERYKKYAQVISVSLDTEEGEIDAFLERTGLHWPVIFHVEQDKRGWNAPLASYYGINTLPTIWITDPNGVVAEVEVTPATLEAKLRDVLLKHKAATTAAKPQD